MTTEEAFAKLARSPFRSRFHLGEKERAYVRKVGLSTLREHAMEFISTRLAPAHIPNDGKQTPMRGHPVFIAQHACACCCRGCMNKWYHVPKYIPLTPRQQEKVADLLIAWIEREMAAE
ncbi:MAG: DUF4186 domain-containing protein [Clostridia bacterium]|nr:DUF4186 domain-containing protein [Clostridia bacterium]